MSASTSSSLVLVPIRLRVQVLPLRFPRPRMVERASNPWMARQLHLFNLAYRMDDDANAIRVLYLLWEDLGIEAPGMEGFKYIRDFVSHPRIDFNATVAFIEAKLGAGTNHYDPFNQEHRTLLETWRQQAEKLVRADLERRLSG